MIIDKSMLKVFRHRSLRWMIALSFIICHLSLSPVRAQIGTWRNYRSYAEPQQIQAASNDLFVLASGSLYLYNKQDQSIYTYDKTNGMSDVDITHIKWCPQAKRLVVVYSDSNIDLVEVNGNVTNVNDLFIKAITGDKTINNVIVHEQYAFLACGFGVVKLDVKKAEISESYQLGTSITDIVFQDNSIYAKSNDGTIWKASLSANLIDPANWTKTNITSSFVEDLTDYNKYIEEVKTLQPGGPKYNYFFNMKVHNGKLYTVGGGFYQFANFQRPGIIQIWNGGEWITYPEDIKPAFANDYLDVTSIAIDPLNENHVVVASCSGLYEFLNGIYKKNYTAGNVEYFESAASNGNPQYVRTDGIIYDKKGNLYCLNSHSTTGIIKWSTDGQWSGFMDDALIDRPEHSMRVMKGSIIDSRGLIWFVNAHSDNPAAFCYDIDNRKIVKYDNFINEDNTPLEINWATCVCEDKSGNIWIGTDKGPVYLDSERIADKTLGIIQHKVPRNDGTDYADYLLAGIQINCMAIDEAGRKWFGTNGNGVYLISNDNNTQEQHFTTENSKLLSNVIESISINNDTGEVFFGTEKGLCSYISDATTVSTEMTKDNVWAYPNPVQPDYTGLITIVGLTYNADVKILSSNGTVVAEGRSNGGSFTWNGCDKSGQRVASGVYMVATATKDGNKGTVCKIAIIK